MWCTTCRQEVPGVASPADGPEGNERATCCIRCGTVLLPAAARDGSESDVATAPGDGSEATSWEVNPLASFETWELDEQLRHVERLLAGPRFNMAPAATHDQLRIDVPANSAASANAAKHSSPDSQPERRKPFMTFMAWTFLEAGLTISTCGAVLTGWSIVDARGDLWNVGLPTALAGLLALLIGLVLQLGLVWHSQRILAADLARVERQLGELSQRMPPVRLATSTSVASSLSDERGV